MADHKPSGVELAGAATTASGVAQDRVAVVDELFGFLDRDAVRRQLLDGCDCDAPWIASRRRGPGRLIRVGPRSWLAGSSRTLGTRCLGRNVGWGRRGGRGASTDEIRRARGCFSPGGAPGLAVSGRWASAWGAVARGSGVFGSHPRSAWRDRWLWRRSIHAPPPVEVTEHRANIVRPLNDGGLGARLAGVEPAQGMLGATGLTEGKHCNPGHSIRPVCVAMGARTVPRCAPRGRPAGDCVAHGLAPGDGASPDTESRLTISSAQISHLRRDSQPFTQQITAICAPMHHCDGPRVPAPRTISDPAVAHRYADRLCCRRPPGRQDDAGSRHRRWGPPHDGPDP